MGLISKFHKRSFLISLFAVTIMGGLMLAKFGWATNYQLFLASVLLVLVIGLIKPAWLWLAVAILGINIGLWRAGVVIDSYQTINNRYGQLTSFTGRVEDDPAITERYQTEFHINKLRIRTRGEQSTSVRGRLKIRGFPTDKLNRGDEVEVRGWLNPSIGNRQGQIYYAAIKVTSRQTSTLESLRRRFFAGVYTALPEPQASLGLGFLVGLRALLPDSLTGPLSVTGLTHIVAVSGFNLTILVRFTRRLFARYSKYMATASSLSLIAGFLAVTGLAPSISRAALVALLAIGAWYYGRPIKASILILVPAALTAVINPGYLWSDIGWYLSFLAFFGVLVIAPLAMAIISRNRMPALLQILTETLSAQLMALPLIIYIFGQLSIIAPVANLIILPLIPITMLLTFVAGLGGMLIPLWAGWLAWPANHLLTYMVEAIAHLGGLSFASTKAELTFWQMLFIYGLIILVVIWLKHIYSRKIDQSYSVIR